MATLNKWLDSMLFPNEFRGVQGQAAAAGARRGAAFGLPAGEGASAARGMMANDLVWVKEQLRQQRMAEYAQALQSLMRLGTQMYGMSKGAEGQTPWDPNEMYPGAMRGFNSRRFLGYHGGAFGEAPTYMPTGYYSKYGLY